MGHAGPVQRPAWRSSPGRRALLGAFVLPLVAGAVLWLRTPADTLTTVDLPAVGAAPAAAAGRVPAQPDGQTVRLRSAGRDRAVLVQEPSGDGPARGLVMVLGPHGLTSARTAQDLRFDDLRAAGFAVAYPSTLDGDWNAGRCCGSPVTQHVDDVRFLQDVRGMLLQRFSLPARSVGLVGYSTGGQMAYRTVCEHPTFASAVVVVAGSLETACAPHHAMPATLVVHGMQDSTVPWETSVRRTQLLDYAPTPALTTIARYAESAGCGERREDFSDGRHLMAWEGCRRLPVLQAVGMPGTGHGWGPLGGTVYATRFLTRHVED